MKNTENHFVVGIGASAGGLDAVQQLFDNLPDNSGMAFVIIQHLSPDFKSLMPELLSKHTKMKIYTAEDKQMIKPNCVYLNERSKNLQIKGNKFVLLDKATRGNLNLPIDIFFHSLGQDCLDKSFGVILSGTGSDGSRGIKTIKEAGGTILVQEPSSAQFDGMPNSAISTNLTDFILTPEEIAHKLILLSSKRLDLQTVNTESNNHEKAFDTILELIYKHSGINFKKYKNNTLLRRLEKRMSVYNIETLSEYSLLLKNNLQERSTVYQEFLIGVTSFFRDTEAFNIIKKKVIPSVVITSVKPRTIRLWVSGCSTGEEVYSIAILLEDHLRTNKLNLDYKIFATDIDRKALHIAGAGSYPVNNIVEIENKYLEEYFLKVGDRIQIVKRIREKIVFSYHDVTKDPPFIRMDFISCRNLLIYFNNITQKKVLNNFQYALNKSGYLFLGSSESLGTVSKYFEVIDTKWKIYKNISENTRIRDDEDFENEPSSSLNFLRESYNNKLRDNAAENIQETLYYKFLSQKHAPTSVFIDKDYNILFIIGDLKEWFSFPSGLFQNNLLKITDTDLATIIRNGIRRVTKGEKGIVYKDLVINTFTKSRKFDLSFELITHFHNNSEVYLIEFGQITQVDHSDKIILSDDNLPNFSKQQIEDLQIELKENRSELQNVVEELETSNEELQSSNEELMSSNEELQSSNEELQSVNEELYTVNSELQEKNKELEDLNNDINNLLNSNDVGTLFLDTQLNIRKFTPSIKRLFHLEETDIGRSIISFASEFDEESRQSIITDSKESLDQLTSFEREIQDKNGNWFLKRICPFITSKKKIDGIVITFIAITNLKKVQDELKDANNRLDIALQGGEMAWWEVHLPEGSVIFSSKKTDMLGYESDNFKHYSDFTKLIHPDDYENTMQAFREHLSGKKDKYECQYRIKNYKNEYQWFYDIGMLSFEKGDKKIISGIVNEITHNKVSEFNLLEAQQKAEIANIYKNQFLANMSHEIRTPMNGLVGFASLLREDDLNPETKNMYIDIIENSSKQLLNLINDIIDISKIEARELKIEKKPSKISELFYSIQATFNELKKNKHKEHLNIIANIPIGSENLILNTDSERLHQVIINLVNNALKFTESGTIEFGYEINKNKIIFFVKDQGIGIPKDKLDVIFERFAQIKHENIAKNEGTGLGLSISKGIVDLLGGELHVESQESIGSTFYFELPYSESNNIIEKTVKKIEADEIKDKLKNKTILIVEDEIFNIEYFKALFSNLSSNLIFAFNGHEALNIVKSSPNIDIILMDIRMPIMDGYETAKEILKENPEARIIAQTAYAMAGDKTKCLQNGFVDYVSKPINKDEILTKMAMLFDN
ncbi:MAG: chemotaxis protein CheB [Bacteroidales bacterium]